MSLTPSITPSFPSGPLSAAPAALHRSAVIAAYLVLGALALSPLLWAAVPPLVDYPDHLARMWILLHARDIPALAQNYVVDWRLLPNLAMDLIVPGLAQILPLEVAGRLFIALTMANLVMGTMMLHRALFGRVGLWPLASLLFVYNAVLFWGFLNFLFTLGLAFLTFSAWVASVRWRWRTRVIVFSLPATLLLVFHLFAFGIYGLLVALHGLGEQLERRCGFASSTVSMLLPLTQFLPAVLLWLIFMHSNGGPTYTDYGGLASKIYAVFAPGTFDASPVPLDRATLLVSLLCVLYGRHTRALKIAPAMRMPIAGLFVLALLMPNWLSGSWGADFRLPVALPFVLIAGTRLEDPRRLPPAAFALAAVALLGLRIWAVSATWWDADRHFAEFRAASQAIPEGARLLVVQARGGPGESRIAGLPPALARRQDLSFSHMPELAAIDRAAFIPCLFTGWTPVRPNPRHSAISESQCDLPTPVVLAGAAAEGRQPAVPNQLGELPHWRDWPETFDFVLWIDFSQAPAVLSDRLQPWASGSFFRIYRIERP